MAERAIESSVEVVVDLNEKKPIKVLHVDDEPGLLKISKQCLEMQGPFQVDTASSAEEALEKLKKDAYDAVISDYKMPSKDGLELLKELRQGGNNIPFVMFTGKGREEVAIKALNFGADQYINKTGDPETVYCELDHALRRTVERKKAETALKTLGEKYRRLFESAIDGILINGSDGKISSVNHAAVNILGYSSPKDLIGKPAVELYANPEVGVRLLQELMEKGHVKERELTWKKRDGTLIEILASITVRKDEKGKMLRTEGIIRDVTERKNAEEELRRFSTAVRASLDGIITGDLSGNINNVNDAVLRTYGDSNKGDFIGKNVLDFVVESDRTRALQDSLESMRTGHGKTIEYRVLAKNGTEVPVEITTTFMRDEQGEPIGFVDIIRNIAERKKGELALKESEARYRSLVEQSLAGIIIAQGPPIHAAFVNRAMTNIWGYTAEEFYSLSQQQIEKTIHPEDRSLFFKSFEDRLEGKNTPDHYEFRALRKDGNVIWLEISAGLIEYNGRPAVQGIFTDITERKKIEQELCDSEERFRAISTSVGDAMILAERGGKVSYWNPAAEKTFGYKKEVAIGKEFYELVVPEHLREDVKSMFRNAEKLGMSPHAKRKIETTAIREDGSQVPVELSISELYIKGNWYALCLARDISERKKAEEVLQKSEEQFRTLMEEVPIGICNTDLKGKITYINKRFEEATGYSREEIVGKKGPEFGIMSDETLKLHAKRLRERLIGKPSCVLEGQFKCKDGEWRWAEAECRFIKKFGLPVGVQLTIRDITERKRAEQERKSFEGRLSALNNYGRDLNIAKSMGEIYELALDVAEKTLGFEFADILLVEGKTLRVTAQRGDIEKLLLELPLDGDEGITVRAAKTGKPVLVSDISKDSAYVSFRSQIRSELAVPIKIGPRVIGVLNVESKKLDAFDEKDQELIEVLASHAATAISNLDRARKLDGMNEKLRVVGGLTGHDIRNKLSAITSNTYLLKRQLAGNDEAFDKLRGIEKAVQQATEIFDFARAYEMLGAEELVYTSVEKTFNEATSLFANQNNIKVINDCQGLTVLADSLLRQLFYNLIDNSLKYGQKTTMIRVCYEKTGKDSLKLIYEDDGVGIPAAEKPKLFREGYSTGGSTGYGLYLIKKIIEVYGWTIQETGTPGNGVCFTIVMPEKNQDGKENYLGNCSTRKSLN